MLLRLSLACPRTARTCRYGGLSVLCTALMAALAALAAAPVQAATTAPESVVVSPVATTEVLEAVPLEALNTSELAEVIGQRPGFEALPETTLTYALEEALETLADRGVTVKGLGTPSELVPQIEHALAKLLSPEELAALLKGNALSAVLTRALAGLEPEELVEQALESSTDPEVLLTQALYGVNPGLLANAVGGTLAGEPFTELSVGHLESALGASQGQVAEALGAATAKLPGTVKAFTSPLSNGHTLGVLTELQSIDLGTVKGDPTAGETGGGGSGSGGSGAPAPTTTIIISGPASAGAGATASVAAVGKVKVIGHKVHGNTATVVLQVPSAGSVTISASGLKKVTRQTARGERVTVKSTLTKAGIASRRHHHRGMSVKLTVTFTPVTGAASVAGAIAHFG